MNVNPVEKKENILAGIVGAFLFSLVGGVLWFVLYQIGYFASISGLIGVICAVKGYTFFAKTKDESTRCVVISAIITAIVLAISWYFCVAYDIYLAYQDWFAAGEVDFTLTFFESVRAVPYFFEDKEILLPYLKDLGIGLLFAFIGVIHYLSRREKKMKMQAEAKSMAKANAEAAAEDAEQVSEEVKNEAKEAETDSDAE